MNRDKEMSRGRKTHVTMSTLGDDQPSEEFAAGTLPVIRILPPIAEQTSSGESLQRPPVALVDTSSRPALDLGQLARLHAGGKESATVFTWDMEASPEDIFVRLTCLYTEPVRVQFALLFHYSQHREFLRWVLEHNGVVPLADQSSAEPQVPDEGLMLHTTDKGFAYSLRLLRLQQLQMGERPALELEDMLRELFAVSRWLPISELVDFAREVLEIPLSGTENEILPDVFSDPVVIRELQGMSQQFHSLLLRLMLLDGISSGFANGTVYFFTDDWLAEHHGRPLGAGHG